MARYAKIKDNDVSNGPGIRVALYFQGCPHRCPGCFNPETWDSKGGQEWTSETLEEFAKLFKGSIDKNLSLLGGEPLALYNIDAAHEAILKAKEVKPNLTVWVWTGYHMRYENFLEHPIYKDIDVLVDGRFIQELKDLRLRWRGSSNQRLVDVQLSMKNKKIILYQEKIDK